MDVDTRTGTGTGTRPSTSNRAFVSMPFNVFSRQNSISHECHHTHPEECIASSVLSNSTHSRVAHARLEKQKNRTFFVVVITNEPFSWFLWKNSRFDHTIRIQTSISSSSSSSSRRHRNSCVASNTWRRLDDNAIIKQQNKLLGNLGRENVESS